MKRHIYLVPGFFGFANLGDFAYWGRVVGKLEELFDDAGEQIEVHCVNSLPTASLRQRSRYLLEAIAASRPRKGSALHIVGHSTGGLDARLLLTPAVDLQSRIDTERLAAMVCSSVSVATPHFGAPIASFFNGLLGARLLRVLSLLTMVALRGSQLPLRVWAETAGMFTLPIPSGTTGTLAGQVYGQLLQDFNPERRTQVRELLREVQRDQSLLTQLTVEAMDLFNAAAGDRDSVRYGSVVTEARRPGLTSFFEVGIDPVAQAQHTLFYSLSRLASGYRFPGPGPGYRKALRANLGALPDNSANDGIVPTLSQLWGECIAVARADHLDIIGHHGGGEDDPVKYYDWLTTRSEFREPQFHDVWSAVAAFMLAAE